MRSFAGCIVFSLLPPPPVRSQYKQWKFEPQFRNMFDFDSYILTQIKLSTRFCPSRRVFKCDQRVDYLFTPLERLNTVLRGDVTSLHSEFRSEPDDAVSGEATFKNWFSPSRVPGDRLRATWR